MIRDPWLKPYIQSNKWRLVLVIFLGCLTAFLSSALLYTSGYLISKAALRPDNILMIYVQTVLVRAFSYSKAVSHYVERLFGHDVILRIVAKMRVRLYRILEPQALFVSSRFRTGDILGALAEDIEKLQDIYLRTIFPSLIALGMYGISIAAIGYFDLQFALMMLLYIGVLIFIIPWVSLLVTKARNKRLQKKRNQLYQSLTDAVMGMSDWVISGRTAQFVDKYEAEEREITKLDRELNTWKRWRMLISQGVAGLTVVTMVIWAGQQFAGGRISDIMIAGFVLIVFPLMDSFLPVSEAIEKLPRYRESFARLNSLGDAGDGSEDSRVQSDVFSIDTAADQSKKDTITAVEQPKWTQEGRISLQQVSFRYQEQDAWSVRNITLDVPQGKKLMIIGRSGAGKSTLLKLIQGALSPVEGTVTIEGQSADSFGDDISSVVAVLNQSPHLFDTTVANNIRLGKPNATDEEIAEAVRRARLDELIQSLPAGLATPMHETGQRFSGGERQRVALSRILLQNTPVVILDEPTVGLDPRTEKDLLKTILETLEGKSLIWVTHHLVGAEQMDEIIFMENGEIEMRGTHAELMERNPRYRRLYHLDRPEHLI